MTTGHVAELRAWTPIAAIRGRLDELAPALTDADKALDGISRNWHVLGQTCQALGPVALLSELQGH